MDKCRKKLERKKPKPLTVAKVRRINRKVLAMTRSRLLRVAVAKNKSGVKRKKKKSAKPKKVTIFWYANLEDLENARRGRKHRKPLRIPA